MSRVLQVSSFPTIQPVHGGQRRAAQIASALERRGHHVHRVAAYTFSGYGWPPSEPAIDLDRFPAPRQPTTWLYDGVQALSRDADALASFAELCERERPEVIVLEEVWLWPAVRSLDLVAKHDVPVIYNSYNIEAPMFGRLLARMGHARAAELARDLASLETDLAQRAFGCSAVTAEDAAVLRSLGAQSVVVAPNGVEHLERRHLAGALPEVLKPEQRYVLYVASSHPPNASGLPDFFMAMLTALRPRERLVAAGGVCHFIDEWLRNDGPTHLARERLVLMGQVTDLCLNGLIANAAGLVLPLREGGGSNLKTAEALYSRLPLVATSVAMRGFDAYRDLQGIIIADDPAAFAHGMRQVLDGHVPSRPASRELDRLLWKSVLQPIVDLVGEVAGHTGNSGLGHYPSVVRAGTTGG